MVTSPICPLTTLSFYIHKQLDRHVHPFRQAMQFDLEISQEILELIFNNLQNIHYLTERTRFALKKYLA